MTDAVDGMSTAGPSPGHLLRTARESRGLSLQEAADGLNLKVAIVEALEGDRYDILPPRTFVKGYLRSYARLVGVKEYDVLAAFEQQRPEPQPEAVRPALATSDGNPAAWLKWLVLAVGVLLLVYAGFRLLQPSEPEADPQPAIPAAVEAPAAETEPAVAPAPVVQPEAAAPQDTAPVAPDTRAPAPAAAAAPAAASEQAPAGALMIAVKSESWIEVVDSTGAERFVGLVQGPRILSIEGVPPFDLLVGNAAAVDVRYDGRSLSLPQRPGRVVRLKVPAAP